MLRSISRIAPEISSREHMSQAARVRDLLAAHTDAADLIQIGAYVAGSDPRVDAARVAMPRIEALVRQELTEAVPRDASLAAMRAIATGAS